MKYREARLLKVGDQVLRLSNKSLLIISSIELLGQYKRAVLHCTDEAGCFVTVYHDQIE